MLNLQDKTVVVSGAASGIGAVIAKTLLDNGAFLVCVDIAPWKDSELNQLVTPAYKLGADLSFAHIDAGDEREVKSNANFQNFSSIHGLVNCAGLLGGDLTHNGRSLASLYKMFQAHVNTAFVLTEFCVPRMKHEGSIVNIGSIELSMVAPGVVLYATAKGALWGMTVSYAVDLAKKGIRVNMVSPGDTATQKNIAKYKNASAMGQEYLQGYRGRTPLGQQSVDPEEVASTVLFLLSVASRGITGQNIYVDRGYMRQLIDPHWFSSGNPEDIYK